MLKLWGPFRAAGSIASVAVLAFMLYGATSGNINWTQIRSGDRHGTDAKGQSSDGTGTSGNVPKFDANGGIVDGGVAASSIVTTTLVPLATGTSHTFSGSNDYFVCTGTCTITVPVPSAGLQYCVANDDNVSTVITLSAIGSSARYENTARTAYGTAGTGTAVSGGAVGDKICIIGRDSTHYLTLTFTGTWTMS